jgi:hypothetical protein
MSLPQLPPPVEMNNETKRNIIDALKQIIEIFKGAGKLNAEATYGSILHDPRDLYRFIRTYRANTGLAGDFVKDKEGNPVTAEDELLVCGVTLAQIQQLLVKTCARHFLEQENKEEVKVVTETVKKKVLGVFTKTEQVERKVGGGFDERKVRDISKCMAFDWQLPLLPAYNMLNSAQLFELGDYLHCLTSFEGIRDYSQLDQPTIKKAKQTVGDDFPFFLANRPAALSGVGAWSKEMYLFYRKALGDAAFDFFSRDKQFYMVCAALDKPLIAIYGDVLGYIDSGNLEEMQRLNIDKTDVLIQAMRTAFGPNMKEALSNPNFAKDMLRKVVESLQHVSQEKAQLAQSAMITCKALAPQVANWVEKQKSVA